MIPAYKFVFLGFLGFFLGAEVDTIGADTPVRLGAALVVGSSIITATAWVVRTLTKNRITQKLMHQENQRRFKKLERAVSLICKKQGIPIDLEEQE